MAAGILSNSAGVAAFLLIALPHPAEATHQLNTLAGAAPLMVFGIGVTLGIGMAVIFNLCQACKQRLHGQSTRK